MVKSLLFLSVFCAFVFQDKVILKYHELLTSKGEQEWILKNTNLHLSGSACTNGLVLTFSLVAKKVIWKQCIDGKWNTKSYSWKIEKLSSAQYVLNIDSKGRYDIDFIKDPEETEAHLRLRSSFSKKDMEDYDMHLVKN